MRVLRCTQFSAPDRPTMVIVPDDGSLADTLESVLASTFDKFPEDFITYDIFEIDDGADMPTITAEAARRTQKIERQERHQAFFFFWLVRLWSGNDPSTQGRAANPGATMAGDEPMPLPVDAIKTVFEQLAQHPRYDDFTLSYLADDGTPVTMRHGEIE